jgi:hypothetical protein
MIKTAKIAAEVYLRPIRTSMRVDISDSKTYSSTPTDTETLLRVRLWKSAKPFIDII